MVVVVDPLQVEAFIITRQFEGSVQDIAWLPTRAGIVVGQRDRLTYLDLTTDPPTEGQLLFDFLPAGIAPEFYDMGLSNDGIVLSFAVVPADDPDAPSTPALVNLLGPTLQAPFAGANSAARPSAPVCSRPTIRLILAREAGGLVLLAPAGFDVEARFPAPEIDAPPEICAGDSCLPLEYSTGFPDEFDFIAASGNGAFWALYTNKLYLGTPDEPGLREWLTLPGIPVDVAVSPRGDQIAWVTLGPPEGANGLFISDIGGEETRLLLEDPGVVFFDLQWSPDARFVAFSSISRDDRSIGVLVIDAVSGELFTIGTGCCAEWSPFISES